MKVDLRAVGTHDIREARKRIEKGLAAPPWSQSLATAFPAVAAALTPIQDAPASAVIGLLWAVQGERENAAVPAEVVWTGPEPDAPTSRDTAAVVAGMFRDAQEEVLVSCYALDTFYGHGESIFTPLKDSMVQRGVRASLFFDLEWCADKAKVSRAEATKPHVFRSLYWPFDEPLPDLYYDPRALNEHEHSSMHAKMVVVDRRHVLVGSANLTDRGHTRNTELGVKLDDPLLAERIALQWLGAVRTGGFRRC